MKKRLLIAAGVAAIIVLTVVFRYGYIKKHAEGHIEISEWAIQAARFDEIEKGIQDRTIANDCDVDSVPIDEAILCTWILNYEMEPEIYRSFPAREELNIVYLIKGDFLGEEDHVLYIGGFFYKTTENGRSGASLAWERPRYKKMLNMYYYEEYEQYPVVARGAVYTPNGHVILGVYGNDISECEEYFRRAFLKYQNTILSANE